MNMTRPLIILSLLMVASCSWASGVLANSYNADKTFADAANLSQTRMTLAWDGTNYWTSSGGGGSGNRLAQYNSSGSLLNLYQPGLDMRSIFTDGSGTLFARQFNDSMVYRQVAPGSFASHVALVGGTLDAQSAVILAGNEYRAMISGNVSRWDLSGNFLGSITLSGFGSMGTEGNYPQHRGLAYWNNYMLTYDAGQLFAWDNSGNRVGQATLVSGGTSFDSHFSISFAADGRVWVVDNAGETWRGYKLEAVPEPASMAVLGAGLLFLRRRRRK